MHKLRELEVIGFRGARFKLPLDFTISNRSISVYGENAAGKSTITDALEWYLFNRVDHLWRKDCKEEALIPVRTNSDSSCAGLTRASIRKITSRFKWMDCRVKPGNDEVGGSLPIAVGIRNVLLSDDEEC